MQTRYKGVIIGVIVGFISSLHLLMVGPSFFWTLFYIPDLPLRSLDLLAIVIGPIYYMALGAVIGFLIGKIIEKKKEQ